MLRPRHRPMTGAALQTTSPWTKLVSAWKGRYGRIHFHPVDYISLAYTSIIGLLIIPFHHDVPHWGTYPVIHFGIAIALLEFLRAEDRIPKGIFRFIRTFYPGLALAFGWGEFEQIVTMILPYWANDWVINLDLKLFGCHPTVWLEGIFRPWLTELMNFCYAIYFLFIPVGSMTLYFRNRKDDALDFIFLVFLSYYTNFLLFLLFPAEGAWITLKHLHTVEPQGGLFQALNQYIQANGSVRGGAFPSSHCSGAFVVAWSTLKYQRKLGYVILVLAFGVAMATVYCRYHHAVDPIAGALWGTTMFFVGSRILDRWHQRHDRTATA